jgi:hypothetical protein
VNIKQNEIWTSSNFMGDEPIHYIMVILRVEGKMIHYCWFSDWYRNGYAEQKLNIFEQKYMLRRLS